MLELLNQMDGFSSNEKIKVSTDLRVSRRHSVFSNA